MKSIIMMCVIALITTGVFAQQSYTVNFTTSKTHPGSRAFLKIDDYVSDTVSITDNTMITFKGDIKEFGMAQVSVDYMGNGGFGHSYPFFLSPGQVNIVVENAGSQESQSITGNAFAMDFEYKIYRPVMELNKKVSAAAQAYRNAAQSKSADTAQLKTTVAKLVYEDFQVPQQYIKTNPASLLNIVALEFLGKGDADAKVNKQTLLDLFNSLPEKIKVSGPGKKYWDRLQTF